MITIEQIRNQKEEVVERLRKRNLDCTDVVNDIFEKDKEYRNLKFQEDNLKAELNQLSKEIGLAFQSKDTQKAETLKNQTTEVKNQIKVLEEQGRALEQSILDQLVELPNVPHESVPAGKDANQNVVIKEMEIKENSDSPNLTHWDICEKYDLIDFELGAKITGSGFPVYKGKGAKLQRALVQYFLDKASEAGYLEINPPFLVNQDSAFATGQLPDKEGQMYQTTLESFYLIPTAEVPVTNIVRNVLLKEEQLPQKFCAFSACFRREAGSYGSDVRGLNRLHQFEKVEIVQVVHPEYSYKVLDEMLNHVEGLLKELGLPYRLLQLCGGDTGFASAKTIDFEVWSPAQDRWLEVSSVSNFETFQSNRLKTRFKDSDGKNRLVHTLNGSALALPRIIATILENHQTKAGVLIPECLHPYTRFVLIK